MKKMIITVAGILFGLILLVFGLLYFFQEKLIFFPEKLSQNHQFQFEENYQEINFEVGEGKKINGLLFNASQSKGLIFYLHGNAGSLKSWGEVASVYTSLNYDVFLLDYRGFGKSGGEIEHQKQLFADNQIVYDFFKEKYQEDQIVVLGYSIGTGMAARLAADNNPKQLILQAPYYSLKALVRDKIPFVPSFLLKYKFHTNEYLKRCNMPIVIFHGTQDEIIPVNNAIKLKKDFDAKIRLIIMDDLGHNGMSDNNTYQEKIDELLSE